MKFTIIFETLLMLFHSANSFHFLNGNEEYIPAVTGGSVAISAQASNWFLNCNLKKDGHEICQVTLSTWLPYTATINCASNYMNLKYKGSGRYYVCKFEVPNLQENGNQNKFLLYLSNSSMISYNILVLFFYRFWSVVLGTDSLVFSLQCHHKKHQHFSSQSRKW
jgi:hypothetical protein